MSRIQLALNVSDLDQAVEFYAKLFATPPAKRRPGYANFTVESPPLKLVLIENAGATERLNHLGVEVEATDEVAAAAARLATDGLDTKSEENVTCCYAVQDKVWVTGPDQAAWEIYTVLADAEQLAPSNRPRDEATGCCGSDAAAPAPAPATAPATAGCC